MVFPASATSSFHLPTKATDQGDNLSTTRHSPGRGNQKQRPDSDISALLSRLKLSNTKAADRLGAISRPVHWHSFNPPLPPENRTANPMRNAGPMGSPATDRVTNRVKPNTGVSRCAHDASTSMPPNTHMKVTGQMREHMHPRLDNLAAVNKRLIHSFEKVANKARPPVIGTSFVITKASSKITALTLNSTTIRTTNLAQHPHLKQLTLNGVTPLTDSKFKTLPKNLESLTLLKCDVTNVDFLAFPRLKTLEVSGCKLTANHKIDISSLINYGLLFN